MSDQSRRALEIARTLASRPRGERDRGVRAACGEDRELERRVRRLLEADESRTLVGEDVHRLGDRASGSSEDPTKFGGGDPTDAPTVIGDGPRRTGDGWKLFPRGRDVGRSDREQTSSDGGGGRGNAGGWGGRGGDGHGGGGGGGYPRGGRGDDGFGDDENTGNEWGRANAGKYELIEVLGEGGMGVVWRARQRRPSREVALKLIRPAFATPRLRRRFELEAETLGRLRHPNIAQVYDAGVMRMELGEQPFIAMELVEGTSLSSFAETHATGTRARILLMMKVCEAVQHAHQRGVIHRDLKPDNILVTQAGEPKVLDFGVARLDEGAGAMSMGTQAGQLVGTPAYMSPEQLRGDIADIDTRTDVYALGAVLYELLTGQRAFDVEGLTLMRTAEVVTRGLNGVQRRAMKELPTDLRTIIAKAMETERDRRYSSASELCDDLGRFLDSMPVRARRATTAYVMVKFARRHKPVVGGVAAAGLTMLAGVVGIAWQAHKTAEQRDAARTEAAVSGAIGEFLANILRSADPENALGRELTVRELLDQSSAMVGDLRDQPDVEASVRMTLGMTYTSLGVFDQAERHLTRSAEIYNERLGGEDRRTVQAGRHLGILYASSGRAEEAVDLAMRALDVSRRRFGEDDPETIGATMELARAYEEIGRQPEALALMEETIERARRVLGDDDRNAITLLHNYASSLRNSGRLDEAESLSREVYERRVRLFGPDHPDTLHGLNNLGTVLARLGRTEEAEVMFRDVYEGRRRIFGMGHPTTFNAGQNLLTVLVPRGALDEAEPLCRELVEQARISLGGEHATTLTLMNTWAYILDDRGDLPAAEVVYRSVVDAMERTGRRDHPEGLGPLNNLATCVQRQGRFEEADELYAALLERAARIMPTEHYMYAIFANNRGECLAELGRYDEAETVLLSSERVLRTTLGEQHPRVRRAAGRLADLYERWGRSGEALLWADRRK